ncbi:uncharacterized protein K460DRAFT_316245 [Cucurbitaria berberidis CBS 394.84]|uniref:Uncharacterized protein n=1 Tax=Cucurbitaria berberidis CBS 394.84 TaxID=1168544 RepID=A0A9P4L6T0_9PLEO|nr:uncharacterized protein K460DRAFT_316245 [Cucurbitaria berberidis CBS 394.84]KAF1843652.1 hypothetical protein K460DRAFT_316245 [Cucurbitaria berberidis CBS 394.84]
MRRPPVACRRAVQALQSPAPQHIWISDDLLSLALARLFPTTCPHQKRHGSHVPGPLEARRRAAKRRMTVSANFHPQDSFPPPFSLGALFGFRKDSQPQWRYEPPSLPQQGEPLDLVSNLARSPFPFDPIPLVEPTAPTSSPLPQRVSHTPTALKKPGRAIDSKSTAPAQTMGVCFENFKSSIVHAGDLSEPGKSQLIANAFRSCCPNHSEAWVYNVMAFKHLTELNWDLTLLIGKSASLAVPPTYTTESLEILRCVEKLSTRFPDRLHDLHRLNVKLAEAAVHADISVSTTQDDELLLLVRQLWRSTCSPRVPNKHAAQDLLREVARKIQHQPTAKTLQRILADMKEGVRTLNTRVSLSQDRDLAAEQILLCIPRQLLIDFIPGMTSDLVTAIERKSRLSKSAYKNRLSTWLNLLYRLESSFALNRPSASLVDTAITTIAKHVFADRSSAEMRPETLLDALVSILSQQDAFYAALNEKLLQLIDSFAASTLRPVPCEDWIGGLFSRMRSELLPYDNLMKMTVTLLVRHNDLGFVLRFLIAMDKEKLNICDTSALNRLVADKVALCQQSSPPTEKERQHNALILTTCQRILKVLSKFTSSVVVSALGTKKELDTLQSKRQFQHILDRAQAAHVLPLAYRSLPVDIPLENRIVLIHQLAQQYSLDNTRSQREAWRSIYYLYRHMQQHSFPISPMFTKATVRVAIIRPLSEARFVSARRLIWVCRLVASVEGEEVAKKIESNFWHWRGGLIRHAKKVFVSVGGDKREKAHVGSMRKLGLI